VKVLVTGIAGALARQVALDLLAGGHEVMGLDRRPVWGLPDDIRLFEADIRKRPAEDVFRVERPEAVVHMATVTHFSSPREERYRINLGGTRAVFEHAAKYGTRRAIFVGRHTIYGAVADAPLYMTEAEPPMATNAFPDLGDLVAADLYAASALWRHPEVDTSVLRIVYTLGPSRRGTLATYLSGARVPTVLGFDPLFQFMHERDAARAIVLALEASLRGVYNVAGPRPVPLSIVCSATGRPTVPVPEPLLPRVLGRFGFPRLPKGAIAHLKYPVVVDSGRFREATGFEPDCDEVTVLDGFRRG
jgi:UDP-glucose 4-epimerase